MFEEYEKFLAKFDKKLADYFARDKKMIKCQKGCSFCCKNANFPLSHLEMRYLMNAFLHLEKELHDKVRQNIEILKKSNAEFYDCPFLINNVCSVYAYRPLICRVHGLAYLMESGKVKLPECANIDLNYSKNFDGTSINFEPIKEDLNLDKIYNANKELPFMEFHPMKDWFKN